MSKFKETLNELSLIGYFNDKYLVNSYSKQYDDSSPEKQAALDKHPLLILEKIALHNTNYRDNIKSIKSNLQFIAWVLIINISVAAMYFIFLSLA
jgi:hypothetical protein